jgi:L-fuconolactonase
MEAASLAIPPWNSKLLRIAYCPGAAGLPESPPDPIVHIDAHIHLWRRDDGERFWMRDKIPALDRDFTEEQLREVRTRCGVGAAIAVQAMHNSAESLRLLEAAQRSDQLLGVVAWADLFDPVLDDTIARYRQYARFAGVRPLPPDTFGGDWLDDPRTRQVLARFRDLDVPVDLLVRVERLPSLRTLLRGLPGLRVVLNHGGRPAVMTGELEPWAREIRALAAETAVLVKCSGLVERAGVEWTRASVEPYVATLVDAFGPSRVMFATNWPVSTLSSRYDLWTDTLVDILGRLGLSADDQAAIMGRTAARHYGVRHPDPDAAVPHPASGDAPAQRARFAATHITN